MTENSGDDRKDAGTACLNRDLLGDPARPHRDPRGRKILRKINELKTRVAVLAATGMTREEIAAAVGCCEKTLRKHFLPQLTRGKATKRAAMVTALYEAGIGGNVSAMKAFIALCEKGDASPPEPKVPKLGKKEQTMADAEEAFQGSSWAQLLNPPEAPVH